MDDAPIVSGSSGVYDDVNPLFPECNFGINSIINTLQESLTNDRFYGFTRQLSPKDDLVTNLPSIKATDFILLSTVSDIEIPSGLVTVAL